MRRLRYLVLLLLLGWGGSQVRGETPAGEVEVREVAPPLTAPGVVQARGAHRAFRTPAPGNGYLLVSLGGTNSLPSDLDAFDRVAVNMGFQVLALDYPNSVISTAARTSSEPQAFRRFRQEVVTGAAQSDLVQIDRANSLEGRLAALLVYLGPTWAEFLRDGEPVWEKIVVVGHSQGSGHAAYLGKRHALRGVLLLAGPQDTLADGSPAEWLAASSSTDPDRYLALLHRDDFFHCEQQLRAVDALRGGSARRDRVVVLDSAVKDAHMSVIESAAKDRWRELLALLVE